MSATAAPSLTVSAPGLRPGLWTAIARMGILEWLAYRMSSVMKLVEFPVLISIYYFLFTALYRSLPAGKALVGGQTLNETLTYVALVWAIESLINNGIDWQMGQEMRQGHIAVYLARPLSLLQYYFCLSMGHVCYRGLLIALPIVFFVSRFMPVQAPASAVHAGLFAVALLGSFSLLFLLHFLIGLSALFLESNSGIHVLKMALQRGLGGLVLPLSLLPDHIRETILLTPFPYLYYAPVQIYLGVLPIEKLTSLLGHQWAWIAGLGLLTWMLERIAVRHVHIQGG
ncbi:MAG: hypothetical protein ABI743_10220 [bacterium]